MNVAISLLIHGEAVRFNRSRGDKEYDFKFMQGERGIFPYVSAQCYKKHWREALAQPWSPVIIPMKKGAAKPKDANQGYTAGDPIKYVDDDLFGYMIAGAEDETATDGQELDVEAMLDETASEDEEASRVKPKKGAEKGEKRETTRRTAPIRMHAPVAFSGVRIAKDFQTLSRHLNYSGGNAVLNPNPPSFYTGWLKTRVIIEAARVGKFYIGKNLDLLSESGQEVKQETDPYSKDQSTVRFVDLGAEERNKRVKAALLALSDIGNNRGPSSGALHDGTLRPKAFIGGLMNCADSPFDDVWIGTSDRPQFNIKALKNALLDNQDLFSLQTVYIGLPTDEDEETEKSLRDLETSLAGKFTFEIDTVRQALRKFADAAASV